MPTLQRENAHIPAGETVQIHSSDLPHTKALPETARARKIAEFAIHLRTLTRCEIGTSSLLEMVANRKDRSLEAEAAEELMWTAVLVEYARAFDPGGGGQPIPPTVYTSGDDLQLHNFFMEQRSKHIAHDINDWRSAHLGVNLTADGRPASVTGAVSQAFFQEEGVPKLLQNIRTAKAALSTIMEQEVGKLMQELAQMRPEDLLALPDMVVSGATDRIKAARRQPNKKRL